MGFFLCDYIDGNSDNDSNKTDQLGNGEAGEGFFHAAENISPVVIAPVKFDAEADDGIIKDIDCQYLAFEGSFIKKNNEDDKVEDMENVVFSLAVNSISPVVESSFGYHIFKITKRKRERLLFQKRVEPEIRNKLMSDKLRDAYKTFLEQSIEQLNITVKHNALYVQYEPVSGGNENGNTETTH